MLLTKDYYRVAFENRLKTNQLGDVDDYNLKLAKLKNNSIHYRIASREIIQNILLMKICSAVSEQ